MIFISIFNKGITFFYGSVFPQSSINLFHVIENVKVACRIFVLKTN